MRRKRYSCAFVGRFVTPPSGRGLSQDLDLTERPPPHVRVQSDHSLQSHHSPSRSIKTKACHHGQRLISYNDSHLNISQKSEYLDRQCIEPRNITCVWVGGPQGAVLWPVLFTRYTTDIGRIIRAHNRLHHCSVLCWRHGIILRLYAGVFQVASY